MKLAPFYVFQNILTLDFRQPIEICGGHIRYPANRIESLISIICVAVSIVEFPPKQLNARRVFSNAFHCRQWNLLLQNWMVNTGR